MDVDILGICNDKYRNIINFTSGKGAYFINGIVSGCDDIDTSQYGIMDSEIASMTNTNIQIIFAGTIIMYNKLIKHALPFMALVLDMTLVIQ